MRGNMHLVHRGLTGVATGGGAVAAPAAEQVAGSWRGGQVDGSAVIQQHTATGAAVDAIADDSAGAVTALADGEGILQQDKVGGDALIATHGQYAGEGGARAGAIVPTGEGTTDAGFGHQSDAGISRQIGTATAAAVDAGAAAIIDAAAAVTAATDA